MTNPRVTLDRQAILRLLDGHPVQVATPVGLLEFEPVQYEWVPLQEVELNAEVRTFYVTAMGAETADGLRIFINDLYEVIVREMVNEDDADRSAWHLSIKRRDRAAVRNWRHFQQIKNEICGEECEGLELYPRESRLADNANQYHLYVMPEGVEVPVGFPEGMVNVTDEDVKEYNEMGTPGRQEPMQPGLGIGVVMQEAAEMQGLGPARDLALAHVRRLGRQQQGGSA